MKYCCSECGEVFDEEEAKVVHDHVGDFWGVPAYEDLIECPNCGSDYVDEYDEFAEDEEEEDEE